MLLLEIAKSEIFPNFASSFPEFGLYSHFFRNFFQKNRKKIDRNFIFLENLVPLCCRLVDGVAGAGHEAGREGVHHPGQLDGGGALGAGGQRQEEAGHGQALAAGPGSGDDALHARAEAGQDAGRGRGVLHHRLINARPAQAERVPGERVHVVVRVGLRTEGNENRG